MNCAVSKRCEEMIALNASYFLQIFAVKSKRKMKEGAMREIVSE